MWHYVRKIVLLAVNAKNQNILEYTKIKNKLIKAHTHNQQFKKETREQIKHFKKSQQTKK